MNWMDSDRNRTYAFMTMAVIALATILGLAVSALAEDAHDAPATAAAGILDDHSDHGGEGTEDAQHEGDPAHDKEHVAPIHDGEEHPHEGSHHTPTLIATLPFVTILLCIALLPLIHRTEHWWHKNQSKLLVSVILAIITLVYYQFRGVGIHGSEPGIATVGNVLHHAVLGEYIPFIVLLFSLYTICGGIQLRGDLEAKPLTNCAFLAAGFGMASFIGTTGASMLLIRPLLQTNKEREYKTHTVIFFIFLVSNIGGSLLPIGDPPLFLGYLRHVPFTWTFILWKQWLFCGIVLLVIYYIWDTRAFKKETPQAHLEDRTHIEPLRVRGLRNFVWLAGVVFSVILLVPGSTLPGTSITIPEHGIGMYTREMAQLLFVVIAWVTSSAKIREENKFDFFAILEVAALFIGIFITMQVPIEILNAKGGELGLDTPAKFFWATGMLSSFLDNAPTYVVFFETAKSLPTVETLKYVADTGVAEYLLIAISLGSVFMGANTYIGNGPNFMVKAIAEQDGVKMPSFFGYMLYSGLILIPTFVVITIVFL